MSKWDELTPEGLCRRLVRSIPDGSMWVGFTGWTVGIHDPDGSLVTTVLPSAFFGNRTLDCTNEIAGAGCRSVESAKASAEAAVRKRLEENVEAMGGTITWAEEG